MISFESVKNQGNFLGVYLTYAKFNKNN